MTKLGVRKNVAERPLKGYEGTSLVIADNVEAVRTLWDANCGDIPYAHSSYLKLLEEAGPIDYGYYYVVIKRAGVVVGLVYCQHKPMELAKDFQVHTHSDSFFAKARVAITKSLFKLVKHQMLICGNVLLTGEYGVRLNEELYGDMGKLLPNILDELRRYIKEVKKVKIQSTLLKDFYTEGPLKKQIFSAEGYTNFKVQPDMIVSIDPEWGSYEGYLSAVKSKYRVKFKKVKKKGKDLSFRLLSSEEAQLYKEDMYGMYRDTAERAAFSMFLLQHDYFSKLKETLGDDIILYGVFLEDKMLAFFTYIRNGDIGDAHFLGYNVKLNNKYQIYFNILLKLLEIAIEDKVSYLNLSRTALEIKSSVGAKPYDMEVHLQYHIAWINKFAPYLLSKFVPENEWLPRSPFK